jgi:hypothetical protein
VKKTALSPILLVPVAICYLKSLSSINFRFLFTKNISGSFLMARALISKDGLSLFNALNRDFHKLKYL